MGKVAFCIRCVLDKSLFRFGKSLWKVAFFFRAPDKVSSPSCTCPMSHRLVIDEAKKLQRAMKEQKGGIFFYEKRQGKEDSRGIIYASQGVPLAGKKKLSIPISRKPLLDQKEGITKSSEGRPRPRLRLSGRNRKRCGAHT